MNFDHTHFFALLSQELGGFTSGLSSGTHYDYHPVCIGSANVVEQGVLATDKAGEFIHRLLDDIRTGLVVRVDRFAALEVNVRVLGRTT